ncbi:MAG: 4'-phosphopantetheinyl transferase superfamily protein [Holophagales bacterium]|nr:4'-phosphopantetheinyl transferase superfamily protein [Holophagales bacterium]
MIPSLPFADFIESGSLEAAGPDALSPGDVHLWLGDLRLPATWLDRCAEVLDAEEIARRDRFKFERHQRRFQARRGLLRLLLGRYLDRDPADLVFTYGEQGKPFLEPLPADSEGATTQEAATRAGTIRDAGLGDLTFNISDSSEGLILAFGRWPRDLGPPPLLGVDLEVRRPMRDAEGMGKRVFSEADRRVWRSLPSSSRDQAFLLLWTRKEAILKATGQGILASPRRYSVTLRPGEPARLLAIDGDPRPARAWHLLHLGSAHAQIGDGGGDDDASYLGALAVHGTEPGAVTGFRLRP